MRKLTCRMCQEGEGDDEQRGGGAQAAQGRRPPYRHGPARQSL